VSKGEGRKERKQRWRDRHPEYGREYAKRWRAKNPNYNREYLRKYTVKNHERILERARRYRTKNREVLKLARGLGVPMKEARVILKALDEKANGTGHAVHSRAVVEAQAGDARALVEGD
jgi:hypothetical protein